MKNIILLCLCVLSSSVFALEGWETDAKKALTLAKEEGKDIILVFKNKDWNPDAYGHAEALFKTDEFNEVTEAGFIKLLLPHESNEALQWKVKRGKAVEGSLPVLYFLNQSGLPVHRMRDSLRNGPEWFTLKVKGFPENKEKVMYEWAQLKKLSGKEKYLLAKDFFDWEEEYVPYMELKESIRKEDKEDISGFRKAALTSPSDMDKEILESLQQFKLFKAQLDSREDLAAEQKVKLAERYFSQLLSLKDEEEAEAMRLLGLMSGADTTREMMEAKTTDVRINAWEKELNRFIVDYPDSDSAKLFLFTKNELIALIRINGLSAENLGVEQIMEKIKNMKMSTLNGKQFSLFTLSILSWVADEDLEKCISYSKEARDLAPWTKLAVDIDANISYIEKNKDFMKKIAGKLRNRENPTPEESSKLNEHIKTVAGLSFAP